MFPEPMKCYANMLSENKVFLSNNFIGSNIAKGTTDLRVEFCIPK